MATLAVHVTPKAGRDEVGGWRGSVPKTAVRVARGGTSRHKLLEVDGVSDDELRAALGDPDQALF